MANINKATKTQAHHTHRDDNLQLDFTVPPGDKIAGSVDQDLKNVPEGYAVIVLG